MKLQIAGMIIALGLFVCHGADGAGDALEGAAEQNHAGEQTGRQHGIPAAQDAREREDETIQRCIRDLECTDSAVRHRAALLLGKYDAPEAVRALCRCLHDQEARIRHGALVSLTEDNKMLPPEAASELPALLKDGDVHVRRLASSLLVESLAGIRARHVIIQGNVRFNGGERLDETQKAAVLNALEDEDAAVRRNVLKACLGLGIDVPQEKIRVFLSDTSAELRILALQLCMQRQMGGDVGALGGEPGKLPEALGRLAEDAEESVRYELCRCLAMVGMQGVPVLRKLSEDSSAMVRVAAVSQLARLHLPDSLAMVSRILADRDISLKLRQRAVALLRDFPADQTLPEYQKLLADPTSGMAAMAMQGMAGYGSGIAKAEIFIPFVDHDDRAVADSALTGIRLRVSTLTAADIRKLLACRNPQAKQLVLRQGLPRLSKAEAGDLLLEACMDTDTSIRLMALKQLSRYRPDGWLEILIASLEDDEAAIQQSAAQELCRFRQPEILKALKDYLPRCQDVNLTQRIRMLVR